MKRICKATTVLLMILCVILTTCSCATDPENNVTSSSSTESLLADSKIGVTIENYEEYLSFLDSADLPEDFVEFDSLSCFGSFYSYVDISVPQDPFNHYKYRFIDENGYAYNIYVCRKARAKLDEVLSQDDVNLSDMRTLPSKQRGAYTMNGFEYRYQKSTLHAIHWQNNGMYYILSFAAQDFRDYPIDTLTPFAKLVNIRDESIAFMNELLQ